ncbi:MAG: BlaI/MecI/CopY family transcriptional regulator [Verrucomicrobiales bacterium]|nr:BlaI/MecI/CopY family transcriptional regulator [Verrucomicrobiales bacterium]
MNPPPPELTEAEWRIIKTVWDIEPCSAPDVHERLRTGTEWAYSTVRTLMDRMTAKRLLTAEKLKKLTLYRSAVTREQAQQSEVLYTLIQAFEGAMTPMIQRLIDTRIPSNQELDELEAIIRLKRQAINQREKGSRSAT